MKRYGLIGRSLKHSFSPSFFKNFFEEHDIDAKYELIELDDLSSVKRILVDFDGCNVTIPYKEKVIPHLDGLSAEAKVIGAVNVIENRNGVFIGHNTDAFGFHQSIKPFLTNQHERALILGTGGASKAVSYVLNEIGLDVFYISRKPDGIRRFGYGDINETMLQSCKVIVNTTPVGMYPSNEALISLPYQYLTNAHLLIDLIYNPEKTPFLREGEKQGCTILNGLTMLKEQALQSYRIWTTHD
jgi:shikimate dehydrogenase